MTTPSKHMAHVEQTASGELPLADLALQTCHLYKACRLIIIAKNRKILKSTGLSLRKGTARSKCKHVVRKQLVHGRPTKDGGGSLLSISW